MKKSLFYLVAVIIIAVSSCFITNNSEAKTSVTSEKNESIDLVVVRTVEDGVHYINIYTDSGTLILKFEEL
ncbi:MAG: hypothetical protein HGGPFJEG_00533 [Ignavibacteria bacterium]|nr:hypothetical protein [Ignavibacteria bacterium]